MASSRDAHGSPDAAVAAGRPSASVSRRAAPATPARLLSRVPRVLATLVLLDLAIRITFESHGQPLEPTIYLASMLVSAGVASAVLLVSHWVSEQRRALGAVVAALFSAAYATLAVVGAYCHRYFHRYPTEHHVAFVLDDPRVMLDYLTTFSTPAVWLAIAATAALFYAAIMFPRPLPVLRTDAALGALAATVALLGFMVLEPKVGSEITALDVGMGIAIHRGLELPPAPTGYRTLLERKRPPARAIASAGTRPRDIVLILNESWGKDHVFGYHAGQPDGLPRLSQRMAAAPDQYVVMQHAFANSTSTDVSAPSLLTGVGPEEPADKLHRMPLISNLGNAAGYRTVLLSSQRLRWAHMRAFYAGGDFDTIIDADDMGQRVINESGIDDLYANRRLLELVRDQPDDEPLLLVYGTNALHAPYQTDSPLLDAPLPPGIHRYQRALALIDLCLDRLLSALDARGRLDDALVVLVGDHGEAPYSKRSMPRGTDFHDSLVGVPMLVKLPAGAGSEWHASLQANAERNVQNLDVMPTIAHATGHCFGPVEDSFCAEYRGHSLLSPVPPDRTLIALSTNDIRRWDNDAFALIRGDRRLVFSTLEGLTFHDAKSDPEQRHDLWGDTPAAVRKHYVDLIVNTHHLSRVVQKHAIR